MKEISLNLKKDCLTISRHLKERADIYSEYFNEGPGSDDDPVRQITLGFDYDQSGWIALIFDTREDAEIDGVWNGYIEANIFEIPSWTKTLYEHEGPVRVTLPNGKTKILKASRNDKICADMLGDALQNVLVDARDKKTFKKVPLDIACFFTVEHHKGFYGWTDKKEKKDTQEKLYEEVMAKVSKLPRKERVEYWVRELDKLASGKDCELSQIGVDPTIPYLAFDRLETLKKEIVVPLLKLARKWSTKSEWVGDRPSKKILEAPHSAIVLHAIWLARDTGITTPEVEKLLREILRRSVKANEGRKLWGANPYHAALCLYTLFEGYAKPEMGYKDNAFRDSEKFLRKKPKITNA